MSPGPVDPVQGSAGTTAPRDAVADEHAGELALLQQAQEADLRDGDEAQALGLYRELLIHRPDWAPVIAPAIERLSDRLHDRHARPSQAACSAPYSADAAPGYAVLCHGSYEQYISRQPKAAVLPDDIPLVSVLMTAHNAESTLQAAIESLLNQDYPKLEVVVCDDASSDGTWALLQALAKRCKPLKILRLNVNLGTYLAKNSALRHATGEIVLFQDADDLSHPSRVRLQVAPLLAEAGLLATRTRYLRFDPEDGRVVPVVDATHPEGQASKYGLITLAVRRRVFREIGHFDAVRRAGDDEWVQRLAHLRGPQVIKNLDVTLYAARLASESLASDLLSLRDDGSVVQNPGEARQAYVALFRHRHRSLPANHFGSSRYPIVPLRAQAAYPPGIAALPPRPHPVFVSLCSIPAREKALQGTLWSLYHQVDRVFLYLDRYETLPAYLQQMPKVTVLRSQDAPGLRDNGKFLAFDGCRRELGTQAFHWFTCDDDILYPGDYVHAMLAQLERFDDGVVLGVHGVVTGDDPGAYFRQRYVIDYENQSLMAPRLVSNLGTGTVAFRSDLFGSIDPYAWPRGGMVDIFFGALCAERAIPMVCAARHAGWLQTIAGTDQTPSLMAEGQSNETPIVDVLQAHGPWGLKRILRIVQAQQPGLRRKLQALLPAFAADARVQFDNYRNYLSE